jgi:Tfp pilus assembly protein FimV
VVPVPMAVTPLRALPLNFKFTKAVCSDSVWNAATCTGSETVSEAPEFVACSRGSPKATTPVTINRLRLTSQFYRCSDRRSGQDEQARIFVVSKRQRSTKLWQRQRFRGDHP